MAEIQAYIKTINQLDASKQLSMKVSWSKKKQEPKLVKLSHEKGIMPYNLETFSKNQDSERKKNNKMHNNNKTYENNEDTEENYFLREAWLREVNINNCQSNEAIEKRHKIQQKKYVTGKSNMSYEDLDLDTLSSVDRYNSCDTSVNGLCRLVDSIELEEEKELKDNIAMYKKNALITGLLKDKSTLNCNVDNATEFSDEFYEESQPFNNTLDLINLKVNNAKMFEYNINRMLQSEEDPDVYYHPLVEQLQKDPEWRGMHLQRKGVETTQTSRQFYLDLDNSSFKFESRNSS